MKLFKCMHCGNIAEMVEDHGVPMICCGSPMTLLKAGTSDGAAEKHVPVVSVDGNRVHVAVGSAAHPMLEEHHISVIIVVTDKGVLRHILPHTGAPETIFALADDEKIIEVYEYCNLHGLWKAEI